ncbi:hypothetical protein PV325_004638 [Microctonus aethiopoides]|nr:hypothetical protein PV325_004638 [Microctonus aethiopoides]
MVLLPRLTYAAVVWWPRVRKEETRIRLRSLQGHFPRAATGAMKTTPYDALEAALNWLPLDLGIDSVERETRWTGIYEEISHASGTRPNQQEVPGQEGQDVS